MEHKPTLLRKTSSFIDVETKVLVHPLPERTTMLGSMIGDIFDPKRIRKPIAVSTQVERLQRMAPDGHGGLIPNSQRKRRKA
jgi:hypothetical protein